MMLSADYVEKHADHADESEYRALWGWNAIRSRTDMF